MQTWLCQKLWWWPNPTCTQYTASNPTCTWSRLLAARIVDNELLVEQLGERGEMIRIQDGGKRVVLNASWPHWPHWPLLGAGWPTLRPFQAKWSLVDLASEFRDFCQWKQCKQVWRGWDKEPKWLKDTKMCCTRHKQTHTARWLSITADWRLRRPVEYWIKKLAKS